MAGPLTKHLSEETLLAQAEGNLSDTPAGSVKRHLERCPDCARRYTELSARNLPDRSGPAQAPGGRAPSRTSSPDSPRTAVLSGSFAALPREANLPAELAELDDYEILGELGSGGPVQTFLANNRLMGRHEVLKVLGRSITERPEVLVQYVKEIGAVARLEHPNIVTSFSAFRSGDAVIFPMEYAEGHDLGRLVKARGPLPISRACYYAHQAAQALLVANAQGLVHRDIKPAHLVVSRNPERPVVKILDFGIARVTVETGAIDRWRGNPVNERESHGAMGAECAIPGTPAFIAPEQIADPQRADIRADIYSLGCTLYYLLSGREPFATASVSEAFQAHHSMDHRPLNLVRPQVPFELAALVAKMMDKEPARRFQTPEEVAQALEPFFRKRAEPSLPMPPVTVSPLEPALEKPKETVDNAVTAQAGSSEQKPLPLLSRRRRPWKWVAMAIGSLSVCAGVLGLLVSRSNPKPVDTVAQTEPSPLSSEGTPSIADGAPTQDPPKQDPPKQVTRRQDPPKQVDPKQDLSKPATPKQPKRPPPADSPEWTWNGSYYVLQAEWPVFDAAALCESAWKDYRRVEDTLSNHTANAGVAEDNSKHLNEQVRRVASARRLYHEYLSALRARVETAQSLYVQNLGDPEVRAEVDERNSREQGNHTVYSLGPSPEFLEIVEKLKHHENYRGRQIGPTRTQINGKSAGQTTGGLPPDF